ncbi:hypothetical protein SLS62_004962 [Diatrype stigma]|uniref:F-box domain-containing protein n=1 Tax=Diatrype stigma TaxID=117547 RepID=A0AAN9USB9_9PEZI
MGPRQPESGTTTVTLNVPNPAVSYGGIDPEIEESLQLVESVSEYGLRGTSLSSDKMVGPHWERHFSPMSRTTSQDPTPHYVHQTSASNSKNLLTLPSELIDTIFSYLTPIELATASAVCRALRTHAISDLHWQRHVLSNLPGHKISSPYPCGSWRELYITHDPYWFLTKHKIWFCDRELTGQMIIVRYDERRGCIEGYQLLATRARDGSEPWDANQGVQIHYFEPRVKLHLDKPILQFNARRLGWDGPSAQQSSKTPSAPSRLSAEHPMHMHHGSDPRFSNFLLAKPLPDFRFAETNLLFPYGYVWPPPAIPARHRLHGKPAGIHHFSSTLASLGQYRRSRVGEEPPRCRSEISDQTFQIRQWMEMGPPHINMHLGEEIVSYATLDPLLYTPTAEKPWRGIWVGDYSGHGCEFLLINQPDGVDEDFSQAPPLVRQVAEGETEADFQERFRRERVYRGRLEAIKLTGDPNVPRGEYTFVADDLGEGGFVGISQEAPFQGARVVKSKGHIAAMGFFDDKYMESQLMLLSHNRLAQHWVSFGHISFYERVDIDQFLIPK